MCEHTRLNSFQKKSGYDFSAIFSGENDEFKASNLTIANLETPLAGEALRYSWKNYQFNTPDEFGTALKEAGIDLVTTANNHVLDRGTEGLKKTLDTLDRIGLLHTGSARNKEESLPLIVTVGNIKIGFVSYTYGTEACYNHYYLKQGEEYMVNLLRNQELKNPVRRYFLTSNTLLPRGLRKLRRAVMHQQKEKPVGERWESDRIQKKRLQKDIEYSTSNSDFTIICLHSGGQFNKEPTNYTRRIAEYCLACGADAVIGNHEHCIQKLKVDNHNRPIAYCLGNFTSDYGIVRKPFDQDADCSVLLHLYLDEEKKSLSELGFSILISTANANNQIITRPLYDLICDTEQNRSVNSEKRTELIEKNRRCVERFLGINLPKLLPEKEYYFRNFSDKQKVEQL